MKQKLSKTGYTRGASHKEIYQNRVTRNGTVLIDHQYFDDCRLPGDGTGEYENGFIVLIEPVWYFKTPDADAKLYKEGLELGENALLLFRYRSDWQTYVPESGYLPNGKPFLTPDSRSAPLGGTYIARVHGTVADGEHQIVEGYNTQKLRGAGIRVYEYASSQRIADTRLQLEALMWLCEDAVEAMVEGGMPTDDVTDRRKRQLDAATQKGLLDLGRLYAARIVNADHTTICPLCQEKISARGFMQRAEQADGRQVYDLTITELNLFHIEELRIRFFGHQSYNLGWGHHFCNIVAGDKGILPTLDWMADVLGRQ